MTEVTTRQPRWKVCEDCPAGPLYRKHADAPEGARILEPGEIHHAGTHEIFPDLASYRRAVGPGSHDPWTEEPKPLEDR